MKRYTATAGEYRNDDAYLSECARHVEILQGLCAQAGLNCYIETHIGMPAALGCHKGDALAICSGKPCVNRFVSGRKLFVPRVRSTKQIVRRAIAASFPSYTWLCVQARPPRPCTCHELITP